MPNWQAPAGTVSSYRLPNDRLVNFVLWALAALVAIFFATLLRESAVFNGEYLPRTNDSLYHARRILDAAIGERGFYEFDERLHVPDGAWVPWPWAYDYLVAKALQVALWIRPALDPMAFIAHVPVFWLGINTGLFLACTHAVGLSVGMRAVAMLGFALSPLVQLSHATGMIDHHYMELTFVLLSTWVGLRWLRNSTSRSAAALLGVALGLAPAFHNGLFILQIPLLACLFLLWLKRADIPSQSVKALGAALVFTTLLIALPSSALRAGMFDFAVLSWFHVYIAICSAATLAFLGTRSYSAKSFAMLAGLAAILAIPVVAQGMRGAMFFSGDLLLLDQILEVQSPFRMFTETVGPMETASYYSWLIVTAPLVLGYFAWSAFRSETQYEVYYAVWAVFGLVLLLGQYRFNYVGLLPLITGPLLLLESIAKRQQWRPAATALGAMVALVILYQPALRERLFTIYAPGGDRHYAAALPIYQHLAELCAEKPGLILADHDDGNALLYHTDCSVIANNFIMRPADEAKLTETYALMGGTPEAIRQHEPAIDYVFVRAKDYSQLVDGAEVLDQQSAIVRELLSADEPPPGFEQTRSIMHLADGAREPQLFARVFRVTPKP